MISDHSRDAHAAWWADCLESGGDGEAVPMNVLRLRDHVAYVDAHTKPYATSRWDTLIEFWHACLNLDCEPDCGMHAGKLHHQRVASGVVDPPRSEERR